MIELEMGISDGQRFGDKIRTRRKEKVMLQEAIIDGEVWPLNWICFFFYHQTLAFCANALMWNIPIIKKL